MNSAGRWDSSPAQPGSKLEIAEQITGFTFDEIHDYTFHASVHSCRPNGKPFPLHECPVYGHQQDGTAAKNESEIFVHKDGHHYG